MQLAVGRFCEIDEIVRMARVPLIGFRPMPEAVDGERTNCLQHEESVVLGAAEECARLLEAAQARVVAGGAPATVAAEVAAEIHAAGGKVPGFGHPLHRPLDPRAERILELADARRVAGAHVALTRCLRDAVADTWGRPLTLNVSLPIAAVLLDLGYPAWIIKSVPILARTAGLLAHLAEEHEHPVGFLLAAKAEGAVEYRDG